MAPTAGTNVNADADFSSDVTCNIASKGVKRRTRITAVLLAASVGAASLVVVAARGAWGFHARAALVALTYLLFTTTFVTGTQVVAKTCVMMGALGLDETNDDAKPFRRIRDEARRAALALRSVAVVGAGSVVGTVAALVAVAAPLVSVKVAELPTGGSTLVVAMESPFS